MINRINKTSLDEFLERRGIEKNNFHLKENSILLQKIISMKRHPKNNSNFNQYYPNLTLNNFYLNQNSNRKNIHTRLIKRPKENQILINQQKKNTIYMNYISHFNKDSKDKEKNEKTKEEKKYDNLSLNHNLFTDSLNSKNEKEKEYIFHTSTKPLDKSNENILNRINRNNINDSRHTNNNSFNKRFFETTFKSRGNKWKDLLLKSKRNLVYKKKIYSETFKKKKPLSRNRISLLFPPNHSKENSICNSIDFSIINKTTFITEKKSALSKTSENFFISSKKQQNIKKISQNKNQIRSRNIKFMNHFIKYCYLYYIIIIKKFFNNFKKISAPSLSNLISNHKKGNIFEEFNKDDFDRETINYKTMDNFFNDGVNLSFISMNKNKKNFVYNRNKRILNQKYQINNLMKILDISHIENDKSISNCENQKHNFDNENNDIKYEKDKENNDIERSPFFNGKSNMSKNYTEIKDRDKDKDNIIGFIQINNEINPFKIKNNNINFFNEMKNQNSENTFTSNDDEILSFRQKTSDNKKNIIKIFTAKSDDNKLNIDIKYFPNICNNKKSSKYSNNELSIEKNNFKINNNPRIKKITMRLKNSRIIKEKEDYIDLTNEENRKNYLYSLSIIKEEDDEKNITDSSLVKGIPIKKFEHYFNISNNSKLYSKASIEKLIDGEKVIKEEDMDNILFSNSSSYRGHNKRSQEIMVVSNFYSVMRNRVNRKENAKSLINGILILIQFFGNLCFNIRKSTYEKIKMDWKIKILIIGIIRRILKKPFMKIKMGN